ncbi:MAG: class I SAM-dependent methyltransferase [Solirubrobacterales bacterium]
MERSEELEDLGADIAGQEWYHTLELSPGMVTPGWFDTRAVLAKLPIPASLDGMRCLDIGTFDGFWAFEMERRGASAVLAIDVIDPRGWDWPPVSPPEAVEALAARKRGGAGFHLAHKALGSEVQHRELSVYELDPGEVGEFDFIYLGSLLVHLRDPVSALERVRAVCRGEVLVVDNYEPLLSALSPWWPLVRLDGRGRHWWWESNIACVRRMIESAGFDLTMAPKRLRMPAGKGQPGPPLRWRTLREREDRRKVSKARLGDPHVAILARPRVGT